MVYPITVNGTKSLAFELFRDNKSLDLIIQETGRARSTVLGYLADFLELGHPTDIYTYISTESYNRISEVIQQVGVERLKPIYLHLNETVPYDEIRIVMAHWKGKNSKNHTDQYANSERE